MPEHAHKQTHMYTVKNVLLTRFSCACVCVYIYIYNDYVVYVCVDKQIDELPNEYNIILYDDSVPYTDRWLQLLPQIKEDIILFLHEDMVLLDNPNHELLELYTELISVGKASSIKLLFAGDIASPSFIHPTLVSNSFSKLSVQPTIIKKETFNNN